MIRTLKQDTPIWQHWLVDGWFPVFPWVGFGFLGSVMLDIKARLETFRDWRVAVVSVVACVLGAVMLWKIYYGQLLTHRGCYDEIFYLPTPAYIILAVSVIGLLAVVLDGREAWVSDGDWSFGIIFSFWDHYYPGDFAFICQKVDLTGIDTLMFDYACYGYANLTGIGLLIDDEEVWYSDGDEAIGMNEEVHCDISIDVSGFSGTKIIIFLVVNYYHASFDAFIMCDNFRTFGTVTTTSEISSGSIISTPISIDPNDTWDIAEFNTTVPEGTTLTIDVLPETGTTPIQGYNNIRNGTILTPISENTIRLRANLSSNIADVSPVLHDWSVSYTNHKLESDWSNIISSEIDDK